MSDAGNPPVVLAARAPAGAGQVSLMPINLAGLVAVARRQLNSLLGNPLAYIFILAFVLAAAVCLVWADEFFTLNLADLGRLHGAMPWLLALLLPALAMNAWAQERESGTEELLLTMPLSLVDAVLGKYLAVAGYFTIALVCSLSNVVVLKWLGDPDVGLLFANYLGWWMAGLAFAAWGLAASVLVPMPIIAFLVGVLLCGLLALCGQALDWFDDFNRGVVAFGNLVIALATAGAGLVVALFALASRRWRPGGEQTILIQILTAVFGLALAINLARIGERWGADADVSVERLSSLSVESVNVLKTVEQPVKVTAFITADLPGELQRRGKEIEDKLKALERQSGGKVTLAIHRPVDQLDEQGALAQDHGIKPRKEFTTTERGREQTEVFLGAAVTSGGRSQVIDYFDPGLSVEYELVRAVRTVGSSKKRVLGIATTDMDINGGFDMGMGGMPSQRPTWQLVEEWKRQYEVREANLDSAVNGEIEVLVVAQPSSLTEPQLRNLHDYIWAGRPALIMEDPLPIWSGPQLAISQPKKGGQQSQFGPDPSSPKKGDIKPLLRALGVDFDPNQIVWSDDNPSAALREQIPRTFVWVRRDHNGLPESSITSGFQTLLLPFPGTIYEARDKNSKLLVKPLLRPSNKVRFGIQQFSDHVMPNFFGGGGLQMHEPTSWKPGNPRELPMIAAHITGIMPSAYPKPDPDAPKADKKKDADGKEVASDAPAMRVGVPSTKEVNVILVADTDFVNDAIFQVYRNVGERFSTDDLKFLQSLRNVQFIANAVDTLAADTNFLAIRARRPKERTLKAEEEVYALTDKARTEAEDRAQAEADDLIAKKRASFEEKRKAIEARTDIDEATKANLVQTVVENEQRALNRDIDSIKQTMERGKLAAKSSQKREISNRRTFVRGMAVGTPAVLLGLLILAVFTLRLMRERTHVPAARQRSNP